MIHSEADAIISALAGIEGVRRVTRSWPVGAGELPCIAIACAGQTPADFRDGRAYLTTLEYYVRIFADTAAVGDAIALLTDAAMERLGYVCVFAADEDDQTTRIRAMRYRKIV